MWICKTPPEEFIILATIATGFWLLGFLVAKVTSDPPVLDINDSSEEEEKPIEIVKPKTRKLRKRKVIVHTNEYFFPRE